MVERSETKFVFERRFQKEVKKFGPSSKADVMDDIKEFQNAWRRGDTEDQLYADFTFKLFKSVHKPYMLYEIYAGPNRKNLGYRVVIIFYDDGAWACWVYAFKKQKQNDPHEVDLAMARADDHWNSVKGGR